MTSIQGNVLKVDIGASCRFSVSREIITTTGTITDPGYNFILHNYTYARAINSIMNNDMVVGFVNLPAYNGHAQFALNIGHNTNNNFSFGFLNNGLAAGNNCYRPINIDGSKNVSVMHYLEHGDKSCSGFDQLSPITIRSYCGDKALPYVNWSGCNKTKNSPYYFAFPVDTDIHGANLENAKFDSNIQGKNLQGVNFKNTNFTNSRIIGREISSKISNLDKADFSNATFSGLHRT